MFQNIIPSVGEMVTSFKVTPYDTNIYISKNFTKVSMNYGMIIQFFLGITNTLLMTVYFSQKSKTFNVEQEVNKDSYWEIVKDRHKVIALFRKTSVPFLIKLTYIIEYISMIFALNCIFYNFKPINSIKDYLIIVLPRICYSYVICVLIQMIVANYAYNKDKTDQMIKKYCYVIAIIMIFSTYYCTIFCNVFPDYQFTLISYTIQGLGITFCTPFFMSYLIYMLNKYMKKKAPVRPDEQMIEMSEHKKKED